MESKDQLREAIDVRLSRMSDKDRAAESRSICRRILEALPKEPSVIAAYYSMKSEVDIKPLLKELVTLGHTVFLPRKEGKHFVYRKVETLENLQPDDFQVPAPPDDAPLLNPDDLSIALVPARAFDRKGNRLGRGNGGFDVWIRSQRSANSKTQFWGIAFEPQIVQEVPMEAHDEKVDAIITARGMINC